ncbi:MAG: peptide chain release factor 2 [Dehalococcoidia bacterium]|nr:MAG: peptide chain release factor 2 [Dehalococcoidia bacterium]
MASEGFWTSEENPQAVMRQASELRDTIETWRGVEREAADLIELIELAAAEDDSATAAEVAKAADALAERLRALEVGLMLSGPHDRKDAILSIHAGAGGTESQDWAEMLLRMYLRWADAHRYKTEILDYTPGEEAGIKSVTVAVSGPNAYGYLKSERGVHRLVRLSPFDSAHRRHTSFALVEVMPKVDDTVEIVVNDEDLEIEFYRSSGAGGQNVQKVSTAVRMRHLPTGLVVTCQNERSQLQNKETALRILKSRLLELELEKREEEAARLKGQHVAAGWGNQIRSYVLHPYTLVKDLRTDFETSDAVNVLEGALDPFIESYLQWTIGGQAA